MSKAATARVRKIAFALSAALAVGLALFRWIGPHEPPATLPLVAAPSPSLNASQRDPVRVAGRPSSIPSPRNTPPPHRAPSAGLPGEPSSEERPTPPVFDFATLPPAQKSAESADEERFRTNDRFTEEDLQHPERYFELAERMPELNRPEERRDTLEFFLAYREKLGRDLDVAGENPGKRQEILATIERYDHAIARLRELVDTERAN